MWRECWVRAAAVPLYSCPGCSLFSRSPPSPRGRPVTSWATRAGSPTSWESFPQIVFRLEYETMRDMVVKRAVRILLEDVLLPSATKFHKRVSRIPSTSLSSLVKLQLGRQTITQTGVPVYSNFWILVCPSSHPPNANQTGNWSNQNSMRWSKLGS